MTITRRSVLSAALGAAALSVGGQRSWAVTEASLDGMTVQTVSDGKLVLPLDFLLGPAIDRAAVQPILDAAGVTGPEVDSPLNVTLLRRGDALVLFDAGSGPDFMPTAGKLVEALSALGVTPDQITHVVFTHAHPDHIWGVLDEFDEPVFPNARHLLGAAERDYWRDPATMDSIGEARQTFAAGAARRIETLGDRLETFDDGAEILPGVIAQRTPGHTPGHTSFVIDRRVIVIGDAIGNAHVALARPDLPSGSDQDPVLGARTRTALVRQVADAGLIAIGYHLPDGGMGRIVAVGEGYVFDPTV